jgi:hypothetical protein
MTRFIGKAGDDTHKDGAFSTSNGVGVDCRLHRKGEKPAGSCLPAVFDLAREFATCSATAPSRLVRHHGHRSVLRRRRQLDRRGEGRAARSHGDEPLGARHRDAQHEFPEHRSRLLRHLGERSAALSVDGHPHHVARVHHALAGGRESGARSRSAICSPDATIRRRALARHDVGRAAVRRVSTATADHRRERRRGAALGALRRVAPGDARARLPAQASSASTRCSAGRRRSRATGSTSCSGGRATRRRISTFARRRRARSAASSRRVQTWKNGRTVGKYRFAVRLHLPGAARPSRRSTTPRSTRSTSRSPRSASAIATRPLKPRTLERIRYGLEKYGAASCSSGRT